MYCKAIVWLQKLSHLQWKSEVLGHLTRYALNCIPPPSPAPPSKFEVYAPGTLYPILESVCLSQRCLDGGGEGR